MYDTVHFWLDARLHNLPDAEVVCSCLSNQRQEVDRETGDIVLKGDFRNLNVKAGWKGILIKNSLARFHYGSNACVLTRGDTEEAIKELSDCLHLPISAAKVCRFDLAQNFIMQHPVKDYLSRMSQVRYFRKSEYSDRQSLLFENGLRAIAVYDKGRQLAKAHKEIPDLFKGKNVLRYEYRFMRRLGKQFKREQVIGADLYDEIFYKRALDKWEQSYFLIQKVRKGKAICMHDVKSFIKSLAFYGIENIGGVDVALDLVKGAKARGEIQKQTYYRLMDAIKEVAIQKEKSESSDIIEELDSKVRQAVACYR
jgi:hypothetical protein